MRVNGLGPRAAPTMNHAIVVFSQIMQERRQHGGGGGLRIVQQDDAAVARAFSRLISKLQFLLRRHPDPSRWPTDRLQNTPMPRDCSRSSVAGVDSKPGKRKNGVDGVVVATPCSRHLDRRNAVVDFLEGVALRHSLQARNASRCDARSSVPRRRSARTIVGYSEAGLPIRKNVARTHSLASAASTFGVVAGHGPSSKVSTTS